MLVLLQDPNVLASREILLVPLLRLILMMRHCPRSMEILGKGELMVSLLYCLYEAFLYYVL